MFRIKIMFNFAFIPQQYNTQIDGFLVILHGQLEIFWIGPLRAARNRPQSDIGRVNKIVTGTGRARVFYCKLDGLGAGRVPKLGMPAHLYLACHHV